MMKSDSGKKQKLQLNKKIISSLSSTDAAKVAGGKEAGSGETYMGCPPPTAPTTAPPTRYCVTCFCGLEYLLL